MKLSGVAFALLAGAPVVCGHMIMAQPTPFGSPNNSPLSPDGSDFPCKNVDYKVNKMNEWKVGEQAILQWGGGAPHGGGSCQVGVTYDNPPSKDSKFKVIYSIEGGCPIDSSSQFPFTIPKELANGEAVMVGTWFNRVGNREFYGNCAPITISGGSDDKSAFEKLPDIAVANINAGGGANCKTEEGKDYVFENPGEYKTRVGPGPFVPLCGGAPIAGEPGAPGGGQQAPPNNGLYTPPAQAPAPTPSVSAPSAPASSASATQAPQQPASSAPTAVTSTIRTLVTITAPTPSQSPTAAPSQGSPSSAPSAPQASQAPSTPGGGDATCETDGAIVCNGANQFGICNHGKAVWQNLAPGTKCENGVIAKKRDYTHRAQRTVF